MYLDGRLPFIYKISKSGSLLEAHVFGQTGFFQINDLSSDTKGGLAIVGRYSGNINVGGFDLPNENGESRGFFLPLSEELNENRPTINETIFEPDNFKENGNSKVINIFPNPFKEQLNVEYFSYEEGKILIEIYDITGKTITSNFYPVDKGYNRILLSNELKSMYGLFQIKLVSSKENVYIHKVIKIQ